MWTAHLFQMTSGQIGPRLNFETMDWSIELNGTENISMTLRKSDLPAVDLNYWLSPWWAGVCLFWNGQPIVAGPIITRPSESFTVVTIGCGGIRSMLAKRVVAEDMANTGWANFNQGLVTFSGLSLGTIAKRVVDISQQKTGGRLPITYAMPDEGVSAIPAGLPACNFEDGSTGPNPCYWDAQVQGNGLGESFAFIDGEYIYESDSSHERNYRSFNVSNLGCDDVLTKLSNVIGGPDIMFRPKLLRPDLLTFELWTGTEKQPRIYQKYTPVWDTTPSKGMVSNMNVIVTGTYQTSRVYATGAGQDEGTLMQVVTDDSLLQKGYPLLETVINDGSSENPNVILDHARSELDVNNGSLLEIQMAVRADGPIPLGSFWPGDLVEIVTTGWLSLPDGVNRMRLLSITGDHTNNVKISLQKEDKFA